MEWTGARYADEPTVEVDTWIDAPPQRVWELVSDITLMPQLCGAEVQKTEWLTGDGPAVGATFAGTNEHDALGNWRTTSHVIESEAPKVFAWAVTDPANPTATWRFTIEPENGGSTLRQSARMGPAPSGLSMAIERLPEKEQKIVFVRMREFEQNMTATVAAVKRLAER